MPVTVEDFEAARPQLLSIAHRMLGSVHDAQDAVQTAWLRAAAGHGAQPVENPAEQLSADEAVLRAENVSRALLVLLERLTPPQRVAYVLHDLFAVPFDRVAQVLDGTVPGAKKHASRARQRLRSPAPATEHRQAPDREIVEAFLAAARTGDTRAMLRLLAPDSVRDADAALLPPGARTVVTGATAIATETVRFADRIRATCPLTVNGAPAHLIAPGGHPLAVLHVGTDRGRVTRITLRPVRPADVFTARAEP
ncbi:RNA polymerase subunit sigma-70 [Streptomyces lavendulae]|nr:sigma factor-like helix-turn-helix DNA-binding protein [Streptomyces lavendulae]TXJ76323.1 RNA polymerase subunit sigma-70 [Streptomyces lavendulae]